MTGQKSFIMDAQDLYNLLVHYTDGAIPLNGEVRGVEVNKHLQRMVALVVESEEWDDPLPFQVRYRGNRAATWAKGQENITFLQREDTPRWQG
jgi:hypothetical protein